MASKYPSAVFALQVEYELGRSNLELYGIAENAYDALCEGKPWQEVKAQYEKSKRRVCTTPYMGLTKAIIKCKNIIKLYEEKTWMRTRHHTPFTLSKLYKTSMHLLGDACLFLYIFVIQRDVELVGQRTDYFPA